MQAMPATGLLSLPNELLTLIGDHFSEVPSRGDVAALSPASRKHAGGHSDLRSLILTNRRFSAVFTPHLDRLALTHREHAVIATHWSVAIGNTRLVQHLLANGADITIFLAPPGRPRQKLYGYPDAPYTTATLSRVLAAGPAIHVCEGPQPFRALDKYYRVMVASHFNGGSHYSFWQLHSDGHGVRHAHHARGDSICSLWRLLERGQDRLLQRLFDLGAREIEKGEAFVRAVEGGHYDAVKCMLAHGVDPKGFRHWRFSPMYVAMQMEHAGVVELLLEAGAEMEVCAGGATLTALHVAAALGYVEGVKMVIERFRRKGASLDILDYQGRSALKKAQNEEWADCVKILEEAGATAIGPAGRRWGLLAGFANNALGKRLWASAHA